LSEKKFANIVMGLNKDAIKDYLQLPEDIRRIISDDINTAFVNRVKAMKRVLKLE